MSSVKLGQDDKNRYADAVFYFANNNTREEHATYSVSQISENWFTPNNIQNLPNFTP